MDFFKKKKVLIPLVVIILFHVINFLYYYVGKNEIEGYWHAEGVNENIGNHYYLAIYQLDHVVSYKGKEYKFIIIGDKQNNYYDNSLCDMRDGSGEARILGFANRSNKGKSLIDCFDKTLILIDHNKMIWNGITYKRDE